MAIQIYAHRGASKYAPENTMSAFQLAYQHGADGIETDVHLTKDNVPVLIHDEQVKRTTNGRGFVHDYTYEELKQLDAGSWFSKQYSEEAIICLETFLQWIAPKNLLLNIELKNNKVYYHRLENIVYELLKKYQRLDTTVISSFNPNSISMLSTFPNTTTALLRSRWKRNLVLYAQNLGANALHINYRLLSSRLMRQANDQNMPVRVYTVNSKRRILRCIRHQCHAIFTDVPDESLLYRDSMMKQ